MKPQGLLRKPRAPAIASDPRGFAAPPYQGGLVQTGALAARRSFASRPRAVSRNPKVRCANVGRRCAPNPRGFAAPYPRGLASWGSFAGHALWQLAAYGGKLLMGRRACRQWTLDRSRLRAIIVQTLDLLLQRNNRESAAPQHRSAGLDRDCLTHCENKPNLKI